VAFFCPMQIGEGRSPLPPIVPATVPLRNLEARDLAVVQPKRVLDIDGITREVAGEPACHIRPVRGIADTSDCDCVAVLRVRLIDPLADRRAAAHRFAFVLYDGALAE